MTERRILRVLIVDDEEPARLALRQDLQRIEDVEIVGECANGFAAVKAVADVRPDVLLLDIQMPKLDGFEVLELLGEDVAVIFVTAYDEFALKAFEVHAIDYLLKPFSAERFRSALTHARAQLAQRQATTIGRQILDLLPDIRRAQPGRDRLVVKSSGRIYFVRT